MSQKGNKCPGIAEYHTFESGHCLNSCDHQCVPASVLVHIENQRRVDKHVGQYLSVTSLLGCLRQLYLERTIDYYVEPPKSWWSLRGSILHRLLQNPGLVSQIEDMKHEVFRLLKRGEGNREDVLKRWAEVEASLMSLAELLPKWEIPNWTSEVEYEYPIGEIDGEMRYLRGTADVIRTETGELYDYKTIGDRGLQIIKDGAKKDHILQFNMYRFLVERGYPVGQRDTYKSIKIKKITAFYMTMMQVARTGGLMTEDSIYRLSNPDQHPNMIGEPVVMATKEKMVLKKGKRHATATPDDYDLKEYKKFRLTYAIPDVPLLDLDEIERLILDTAPILVQGFSQGIMPPMCPPEMRQWKCNSYCPDQIRQACDAHNLTTGEVREVEVESGEIPVEV